MATGALDANGIWLYGEDDSESTFSGLLNKLGDSVSDQLGIIKPKLKILQVVSDVFTTEVNNNTSTYATTGLSLSITPSSTSSKIVIFSSHDGCIKRPGNANSALNVRLMRGATVLQTVVNGGFTGTSSDLRFGSMSINYVDSPATTSSTTYSTEFANAFNGTGVAIGSGSLIVMEVAG